MPLHNGAEWDPFYDAVKPSSCSIISLQWLVTFYNQLDLKASKQASGRLYLKMFLD